MIYVNFNHLCDFIKALLYEEQKERGERGGKEARLERAGSVWNRTAGWEKSFKRLRAGRLPHRPPEEAATSTSLGFLGRLRVFSANFLQKCPLQQAQPPTGSKQNRGRERARQSRRAGEARVMQNVLICVQGPAMLMRWAPERIEGSSWQHS